MTPSRFPDMLECVVLRADHAGVALQAIETTGDLYGCRLIDAGDIPGDNRLLLPDGVPDSSMPALARERIGYRDEPIGLLVGPTHDAFNRAMDSIRVRTEPLPLEWQVADRETSDDSVLQTPDGKTHRVVDRVVVEPIVIPQYEPSVAIAEFVNGSCIVHCMTHWPQQIGAGIAALLALPPARCRVVSPHRDCTLYDNPLAQMTVAALAALAAYHCRTKVRLMVDDPVTGRIPLFPPISTPTITSRFDCSCTAEGRLLATDAHIEIDCGAYPMVADEQLRRSAHAALHCYRCETETAEAIAILSAQPPRSICGDAGETYGVCAREIAMTQVAEATEQSPYLWRLAHMIPDRCRERVLRRAAHHADFERKYAAYRMQQTRRSQSLSHHERLRGIGIATGEQYVDAALDGGRSTGAVVVELELDAELTMIMVRGIWMSIDAGMVADGDLAALTVERSLRTALRRSMSNDPDFEPPFTALPHIVFVKPETDAQSLSFDAVASGCVPAAYTTALSQVLNRLPTHLPAGERYLRSIEAPI